MAKLWLCAVASFVVVDASNLSHVAVQDGGYCCYVGVEANSAFCSQWPLQTVGDCTPQDICTNGPDTTAHYQTTCASLGYSKFHHTEHLHFGSCGGTEQQTASDVYLHASQLQTTEADTSNLSHVAVQDGGYCCYVGVEANSAFCSQWPLQTVGDCTPQDICTNGPDTTAHYQTTCASLGYSKFHHTEHLHFGSCGGTEQQTASDVYLHASQFQTTEADASNLSHVAVKDGGYCCYVGVEDNSAFCSQWPLQTVGDCTPQDICTNGPDTTAHYQTTCASLGYSKFHHTEHLHFGSCGGTEQQTASDVYLHASQLQTTEISI